MPMFGSRDRARFDAFSRRTALVSAFGFGAFATIAGRLYQLCVLERDQFETLAAENRINFQLVPPRRGRVFDRSGIEVASTTQNFRVLLIPDRAKSVPETLKKVVELVPLSQHRLERIFRDIARNNKY